MNDQINAPSYAVKQLAQTLRDARVARGLSQRELAERASLGQNRLALIETGGVDLRASTLVQLGRALDLELVLAPRRMLPTLQSLTADRSRGLDPGRHSVQGTPMRVLRHMQQHMAALEGEYPASEELAQAKSAVQALIEVGPDLEVSTLQALRRSRRWLAFARTNRPEAQAFLTKAAAQLRELRERLPATPRLEQAPQAQRAAYSLEEEIS